MRALGLMLAVLLLLAGLAGGVAWYGRTVMERPLPLPADGATYALAEGTSLTALGRDLARRGWLPDGRLLVAWARWARPGPPVRAGEYFLPAGTSAADLLDILRAGRTIQHRVTLVEGSTVAQVVAQLRRLTEQGLLQATLDYDHWRPALRELLGEERVEGWLFPDTYYVTRGMRDRDLLRQAHRRMRRVLAEAWATRTPGLPLETPYQALILASIVEKETADPAERARIAGVFVQRLRKGMRLQTDPTVIYGLGEAFDGNLRRADLRRDTPYNTYTRAGLPPTPIALPGLAALLAATHPDETGDLYFVATEAGGRHHFSRTYREHAAAVRKYQRRRARHAAQ